MKYVSSFLNVVLFISIIFSIIFSIEIGGIDKLFRLQRVYPAKILYGKYIKLEITRENSVKDYPIELHQAKREWKNNLEVFEPNDTLERDTLCVYGRLYTVDSLSGLKPQYTGAYGLSSAFLVHNKKQEYIIFLFFNGYQMGMEQQGIYIIFKLNKDNATFCASYIENLNYRLSKVKIVKGKDGVYLESKNLDRCL